MSDPPRRKSSRAPIKTKPYSECGFAHDDDAPMPEASSEVGPKKRKQKRATASAKVGSDSVEEEEQNMSSERKTKALQVLAREKHKSIQNAVENLLQSNPEIIKANVQKVKIRIPSGSKAGETIYFM